MPTVPTLSTPRHARLLVVASLLAALAACRAAEVPPEAVAVPPGPPVSHTAVVIEPAPPPPPPLQIVDPPVEPGRAVAVVRGGEPRPVVFYQQPNRISPPGTPLVLPPPIQRGERQETLVEPVPTRIVLRGADQRRFVRFLGEVGGGRFDALHVELRSRSRLAVSSLIGAARRVGVDPLKIKAVDVPVGGGAVEVLVTRYVATAPVCPSLAVVGPSANDNDFEPTLGCSNCANLARMVNDPADLLVNEATVPADGSRAAAGIERYRNPNGQGNQRQDGSDPSSGFYGGALGYGPLGGTTLGAGGPVAR